MSDRIRVVFPRRRATTNPYIVMLGESLQAHPDIELIDFSWRTALTGEYDIIHLHWPEILLRGRTPARRWAKEAAFATLLTQLRLRRRALVRTYHNAELPRDLTKAQERLLRRAESQTALWVVLNEVSRPPSPAPVRLIPHGHYRNWYDRYRPSAMVPGRIGYFGLIRRYKAVDVLVSAFLESAATLPGLSLSIAGKPSTAQLANELVALAADDPSIEFQFKFLSDPELVAHVTAAQLIALTHREMFNSGTALAALSLDRPVLLPRNSVNEALADEVGAEWVLLYDQPLSDQDLLAAMRRVQARPVTDRGPNLTARDWELAGEAHASAYRAALAMLRSG